MPLVFFRRLEPDYFLQQSAQALSLPAQHSAHLSLQQVLQADMLLHEDRVRARAERTRVERMVFMM